jgi:biotin carboxyl carrier protein
LYRGDKKGFFWKMAQQVNYEIDGQTVTVSLADNGDGTHTATVDGRAYRVRAVRQPDGGWLMEHDGQRAMVYTAQDGAHRYAQRVGGAPVTARVPEARARRRGGAAGAQGKLSAQMPGLVADVLVSVGDAVVAGQTLVVLEAMKMEIRVTAPKDGTVKAVAVQKGAVVERDQTLVELS